MKWHIFLLFMSILTYYDPCVLFKIERYPKLFTMDKVIVYNDSVKITEVVET